MLILIIEDEDALRLAFERLMTQSGHRVIAASDGPTGLAMMRGPERPNLIVLDMILDSGGMSGWDVAEKKSNDDDPSVREIPTIILSGLNAVEIRARGMRKTNVLSDIRVIISKVDPDGLLSAIGHIEALKHIELH